jgi:hypothetical protein
MFVCVGPRPASLNALLSGFELRRRLGYLLPQAREQNTGLGNVRVCGGLCVFGHICIVASLSTMCALDCLPAVDVSPYEADAF